MGLHICIKDQDGNDHPEWDFTRHGDDRENAKRLCQDCTKWPAEPRFYGDDFFLLRPTETTELIGDRGREMMQILENPEWWVYLSV